MFAEWKPQTGSKPRRLLSNPLLYTTSALILSIIYVAIVFLGRWEAARRNAAAIAAQRREEDAKMFEAQGGNNFEIMNFYVAPAAIERGGSADICYSTSNAKVVKIDPPVGAVWPSLSRCITVQPKKTTTYTLTIDDGAGHTKTASVTLPVH
jgi:hypothetical protein